MILSLYNQQIVGDNYIIALLAIGNRGFYHSTTRMVVEDSKSLCQHLVLEDSAVIVPRYVVCFHSTIISNRLHQLLLKTRTYSIREGAGGSKALVR